MVMVYCLPVCWHHLLLMKMHKIFTTMTSDTLKKIFVGIRRKGCIPIDASSSRSITNDRNSKRVLKLYKIIILSSNLSETFGNHALCTLVK